MSLLAAEVEGVRVALSVDLFFLVHAGKLKDEMEPEWKADASMVGETTCRSLGILHCVMMWAWGWTL